MKETKAKKPRKPSAVGDKAKGKDNAVCALMPSINAASIIENYQSNIMGKDIDLPVLIDGLRNSFKKSESGDLSELESMLIGQAMALQTIFTSLARRAQAQQYQRNLEAFLSLALKAQAQSRATIQAVVELKYPRQVAFVKQANISQGPQQVNNGAGFTPPTYAHAEENQAEQNKLLEDKRHGGTHMDTRATTKASRSYQAVETAEKIYRPAKHRR
jgi:hypothetical protein